MLSIPLAIFSKTKKHSFLKWSPPDACLLLTLVRIFWSWGVVLSCSKLLSLVEQLTSILSPSPPPTPPPSEWNKLYIDKVVEKSPQLVLRQFFLYQHSCDSGNKIFSVKIKSVSSVSSVNCGNKPVWSERSTQDWPPDLHTANRGNSRVRWTAILVTEKYQLSLHLKLSSLLVSAVSHIFREERVRFENLWRSVERSFMDQSIRNAEVF